MKTVTLTELWQDGQLACMGKCELKDGYLWLLADRVPKLSSEIGLLYTEDTEIPVIIICSSEREITMHACDKREIAQRAKELLSARRPTEIAR